MKQLKERIKTTVLVFIIFFALSFLWFLIGFEVGSNKKLFDYQLYKFSNGITEPGEHLPAPKDRINEDQIWVTKNKIEIHVQDAEWSSYAPTGSMEPLLTHTSNGLYVKPSGPDDIQVGDIISYETTIEGETDYIAHRVIEIVPEGYIVKGDSNEFSDPEPVPYEDVQRVLIGVIY